MGATLSRIGPDAEGVTGRRWITARSCDPAQQVARSDPEPDVSGAAQDVGGVRVVGRPSP